ncbi:MAG: Crp/Fnr family transcriptional regulator [Oscillospiraceae bacterium]|nr:Crp/Fnr family transcriptional regulator [Oscillospiraceae bacterium]
MDREELKRFFENYPDFWGHLNENEKNFTLETSHCVSYHTGQSVHSSNNRCAGVLFLVNGDLRVYIMSEEGKEVTLYRLSAGDICIMSASCVMDDVTFDVYVDATTDVSAVLLPTSTFSKLQKGNIYIENFSNKIKARRFSDVMWTMQQILFFSFDRRLAIFLYDEYVKNGPIIRYSHLEIARFLGSAREVVSRMLKYFESEGIVTVSRKEIEIIDKKKLKERI